MEDDKDIGACMDRLDAYKSAIALVKEAKPVLDRNDHVYGVDINDVLRVAVFIVGDNPWPVK